MGALAKRSNVAALRSMRSAVLGYVNVRRRYPHRKPTAREQRLANNMHALLSESYDAAQLPDPNLSANPHAGIELGKIVVSGALPGEAKAPGAQGFIWLWPAVVVVGIVAFTIVMKIRSDAEVEKEKIEAECIASGNCTDSGFWIKAAIMAAGGFALWQFVLKPKMKRNPARSRKTRDVWVVEQRWPGGHGWEIVTEESNRDDARLRLAEYRENQPEAPVRMRKSRELID